MSSKQIIDDSRLERWYLRMSLFGGKSFTSPVLFRIQSWAMTGDDKLLTFTTPPSYTCADFMIPLLGSGRPTVQFSMQKFKYHKDSWFSTKLRISPENLPSGGVPKYSFRHWRQFLRSWSEPLTKILTNVIALWRAGKVSEVWWVSIMMKRLDER